MTKEELNNKVIIISATIQLVHELLDELEGTSYYRHKPKMLIKQLQKELSITGDDQTHKLWNTDDKSMSAIQEGILKYAEILAEAKPVKIAAVGDLLKNNPELINV